MKRITQWVKGLTLATMLIAFLPIQKAAAQGNMYGSYQTFYNDLAPYGNWIYDNDYGYVWAPNVGNDFRPYYTNGSWAMTQYGNTWISNYAWGWAPFHYGRWTYNPYYGWVWIPGNTWGPAWVSWRYGGGNYGWAPMGPGISINISFGNNYYVPNSWWTFVPCANLYSGYYNNYWRGAQYNYNYINHTTIINNTYQNNYVYGPRKDEVERVTGGRVTVMNLRNGHTAGRAAVTGNTVQVYRPEIRNQSRSAAPQNFTTTGSRESIRNASPTLTGRVAMERHQREMRTAGMIDNRTNNTNLSDRDNRITNQRNNDRFQEDNVRENRIQQDNLRMQQREQQYQERERNQQLAMQQRDQQRIQRQQEMQQQRNRDMEMRYQQRQQQQRIEQDRSRQMQQRATPQREWRRPEPQRMERNTQMQQRQPMMMQQRQSAPVQRGGGGFERGGRR